MVDRWLRWNFKEPEARNHYALKDTHWEGCSKLWFFSKPLADAKITKQAWDLGSLQWFPNSVISTNGFKTFLFLNCGKQKDGDFFRVSPYFLNWVFSTQFPLGSVLSHEFCHITSFWGREPTFSSPFLQGRKRKYLKIKHLAYNVRFM